MVFYGPFVCLGRLDLWFLAHFQHFAPNERSKETKRKKLYFFKLLEINGFTLLQKLSLNLKLLYQI